MSVRWFAAGTGFALCCVMASAAYCGNGIAAAGTASAVGVIGARQLAEVVPGGSTEAEIRSLLGPPWRVVQFNDCGEAMEDQADETWEYRGTDANGTYRVHIEFDEHGVAHLVARIPDRTPGGKGAVAKTAPAGSAKAMSM